MDASETCASINQEGGIDVCITWPKDQFVLFETSDVPLHVPCSADVDAIHTDNKTNRVTFPTLFGSDKLCS